MSCTAVTTTAIANARRHAAHMASTTLSKAAAAQAQPLHLIFQRQVCTVALLEPTWRRSNSSFYQQSQSQSRRMSPSTIMSLMGAVGLVGAYTATTSDDVKLPSLLAKLPSSSSSSSIPTSTVASLNTTQGLSDKYKVNWNECLGKGTYGSAHVAYSKATNDRMALKRISREATTSDEFQTEITALERIRSHGGHTNINQLQDTYEDNENYYLVLEYIAGGELFDHLINEGMYNETDAARLMEQLASALSFLHKSSIVHMDLKPENLLLSTSERKTGSIKIIDFGGAYMLDNSNGNHTKTTKISGTTAYWSPERCEQYSDANVTTDIGLPCYDMWSVGVILYIMLTGVHPFDVFGVASDEEVQEAIVNNRCPPLDKELVGHLSESAIDLITKLMEQNPTERITAEQMLHHPWIVENV